MSTSLETEAPPRTVLALHPDPKAGAVLSAGFRDRGMAANAFSDGAAALARIYSDPPDIIVLHKDMPPRGGPALCAELKKDNLFARILILMLMDPGDLEEAPDWEANPVDDFIEPDAPPERVFQRAALCLARAGRDLDANPLTRLPGNNSIAKQLERRIAAGDAFCAAYLDIDNFKAFNDCYGFTRGDEALRLTARLILNVVGSLGDPTSYVAHIGGDDFFFIVSPEVVETACAEVTRNFDLIIPGLYDAADRARGSIESVNRRGERETFPLMSLSVAVATNRDGSIHHIGQIGSIVKDLKKFAKAQPGSCYIVDRRARETERN